MKSLLARLGLSASAGLSAAGLVIVIGLAAPVGDGHRRSVIRLSGFPIYEAGALARLAQAVIYRNDVLPVAAANPPTAKDTKARANALYQQGLARQRAGDLAGARASLEAALALAPDSPTIRASLGYVLYAAGDFKGARAAFEEAVRRDPSMVTLYDELGYVNLRLGDQKQADAWFRRAIDEHESEPASSPAEATARDERVYRLRSEVAQIENDFDVDVYSVFRRGSGQSRPLNPTGRSLTQSQGGAEAAYRLPIPGLGAGRTVQAFARVLWGYQTDSIRIRGDSYQGGVGLRAKPFASQNLILSFERLVSLGSAARDDWLARVGYSWSLGYGFEPFKTSWPYVMVYGDAALAFPTGPDLFLSGEIRAGESWRIGNRFSITPHLAVLGSRQEDGAVTTTLIEGGPGVSLKYYFNESKYRSFGASAEVVLQYRAKLGGNSTGTSGAAATMVVNF